MDTAKTSERSRFLVLAALLAIVALVSQFGMGSGPGPNYRNYTVDTRVNITGSPPVIMDISTPATVTLNAGGLTNITCNVSIRDYNGWNDISSGGNVNATFFTAPATETSADDNSTHYTNASCARTGQNGYFSNYTCGFQVNYYANNGSWTCHVRVNDSYGLTDNATNTSTINALYALNVTPNIDYGNIVAGEYSNNITANITNFGNRPINITVLGYGQTLGDNLSFVCVEGNLSVDLQHFSVNSTHNWTQKQALNSTYAQINDLTIAKAVDAAASFNTTYWELYVDPNQVAAGECNGTIIFQAEVA